MKRLGQKICVAVVLSLAFVAIWHDSAMAAMPAISSLGQIKGSSVINPTRIDADAAGTIYLSDATVNGVTRYNKFGQVLPTLKGAYSVKSTGVAVTPDGSRVFVSAGVAGNLDATAVAVLNGSTGALLGYLGTGLGEFQQAGEIDLDGSGNIYAADTQAKVVNVYNGSTYVKIATFGKPASVKEAPATGPDGKSYIVYYYTPLSGEFGAIFGLTVDVAKEEILVADGWYPDNNSHVQTRIQIFGLDGTPKRLLSGGTIAGTQISCKASGLSVDSAGRVYMLYSDLGTVHVFTTQPDAYLGKYTNATPAKGFDASGQVIPWTVGMIPGTAFDTLFDPATGRLFVVTGGNGIQIYSVDGSTNPEKVIAAPAIPAMISPVDESEVATLTPTLQWSAVEGAASYNVKLVDANSAVVTLSSDSPTVTTGTLLENQKYGWSVQSVGDLTSEFSATENFWVNAVEEVPTAALLVNPVNAATADKDTLFSWVAATDADPLESLSYRLEISATADFTTPLISVETDELQSGALSTLSGYASLQPGATYQWRVVAVDATNNQTSSELRSFVYGGNLLTIDATFPGAKVYLGGNSAFSGRYIGEVPVTVQDVPGTIEVVVERAGFEPWIKSVVVNDGQSLSVNAELVVAILPGNFSSKRLSAAGVKIQGGAEAAPAVVDFDNDGLVDLLVADGSGKLLLYKGIKGVKQFAKGAEILSTLPVGAVPFVADWDNDGKKDLLVGAADGSVSLYLNQGTQAAPVFAAATLLQANGAPLNVVSNAGPVLVDLNGDGKKDLIASSGNGNVYKFINSGTDAAPVFTAGEVLISGSGDADISVAATDWNADGIKDILVAKDLEISAYEGQLDGSYVKGLSPLTTADFGGNVRLVTVNLDGIRGKDLLVGNAAGQLILATSTMNKAKAISPEFGNALLESVDELEGLIAKSGLTTTLITTKLTKVRAIIQAQMKNNTKSYASANAHLLILKNKLKSDPAIMAKLTKLQAQVKSSIPLN